MGWRAGTGEQEKVDSQVSAQSRDGLHGRRSVRARFVFIVSLAPELGRDQGTQMACWFLREEEKFESVTRLASLASSRAYTPSTGCWLD